MSVGMPASLWLNQFGVLLYQAFGEHAYHVGSSVKQKDGWRDVDVRLMLADAIYDSMGLGDPKFPHNNARWVAFCLAFSALGKQMTGLPVDFQIQRLSDANAEFSAEDGHCRSFLGIGHPQMEMLPEPLEHDLAIEQILAERDREKSGI